MRFMFLPGAIIVILAALIGGCSSFEDNTSDGAPQHQGEWAYLHQREAGAPATIRLRMQQPYVPMKEQIFAWLFYRSADQRYFSLDASRLVDVWYESTLPGGNWDDAPTARGPFERSRDFTWRTSAGEQETVSTQFLFFAPALQPGQRYYHRVQRVVEPLQRAGTGAPVASSAGISPAQFVPFLHVDPPRALSEGSTPTRGVTYLTPPGLQEPPAGAVDQSTHRLRFTWTGTVGANEYVLQVFPADDWGGQRNPLYQVITRHEMPVTISETIDGDFPPGRRFYWRVGARRAGDPLPFNEQLGRAGWLFSEMRTFTSAASPPSPP